jgi:hypothetical protein
MALRVRAPEEFSDVGVSNQFRPTSVDVSAATSFVREARQGLQQVGDIVDAAHDNALRSQALADSVEYETRLSALRAEMDNEAPPEGIDPTDWARAYPQRWQQRSATIREDVSRRRGRRSNSYLRYFDERATQITGREQQGAIERGQAQIVDIDRAAGVELLATLAAGATNPDLPETADGDAPSRSRYEQQYIEHAREMARRGTWSYQFAAERVTQLQSERRTFLETEGRFSRAREAADNALEQFPDDPDQRLAMVNEIENPREREQAVQFVMADIGRIETTRQAEVQAARSRIEVLINRHGVSWRRYATPEDIARIEADPGGLAQIRAQLDSLLDPTGGSAVSRGIASARFRAVLEDLGNTADPVVGRIFAGLDLDAPLTAEEAAALRAARFADVEEGDVLSATLSREDYTAVLDLQRTRRSGVLPNGSLVVDREVDDVVGYVVANGLADFGREDDSADRRTNQQLFRAFVSQIVRDNFASGGARDLTQAEIASISRLALSRARVDSRNQDNTPMYRRRTSNRVTFGEIPATTATRLRLSLPPERTAGLTAQQIDELVVAAYAEENRRRVQGR